MPDNKKLENLLIGRVDAPKLNLENKPLSEEDALTRFMTGLESGAGLPVDSEGGGLAGLAGESLSMPLGAVAAISPKMAKLFGRQLVDSITDPRVKEVFEALYKRYPRVMGHVDRVQVSPGRMTGSRNEPSSIGKAGLSREHYAILDEDEFPNVAGAVSKAKSQIEDLNRMSTRGSKYSGIGIDGTLSQRNMEYTAAHELGHVAQRLLRPRTYDADYNRAYAKEGYHKVPHEIDANKAGARWADEQQLSRDLPKAGNDPAQAKQIARDRIINRIRERRALDTDVDARMADRPKTDEELRAMFGITTESKAVNPETNPATFLMSMLDKK